VLLSSTANATDTNWVKWSLPKSKEGALGYGVGLRRVGLGWLELNRTQLELAEQELTAMG